jgi:energy-coupling factor transporter ATP-binding protein EcfA2
MRCGSYSLCSARWTTVPDPLLECRDVWFSYEETAPVLRGIDLEFRRGEAIALVGQNGSGKTTLAKHMNGLLHPSNGLVRIAGQDSRGTSAGEFAQIAGYVFQNPDHQIFSPSVKQEIAFGPENLSLPDNEIEERVADAIDRFGLTDVQHHHPTLLGRGLRRRVAIASVYALRPELLILDEPTVGLDRRMTNELIDLMRGMVAEARTVVLISHDMRLVGEFAERLIIMHHGEIIGDDDPHELFPNSELMARSRLSAPDVTELSQRLGHYPTKPAVRLQEFVDEFERLYQEQHRRIQGTRNL